MPSLSTWVLGDNVSLITLYKVLEKFRLHLQGYDSFRKCKVKKYHNCSLMLERYVKQLPARLSFCLFANLSLCTSICLYVCLYSLFVYLFSVPLCVCLSFYTSMDLSIFPSGCLSNHLPDYFSFFLSVCPTINMAKKMANLNNIRQQKEGCRASRSYNLA